MPSEFDLIDRYFKRNAKSAVLGIGDDAAIVEPSPGMQILMSTDMLVAGTHFFADAEPEALGWKTLAVNISDLAAMGAIPRWALLAMSLPTFEDAADEEWLDKFARGFFACAESFGVELIGGDTTRGPMNFCVTIFGEAPIGKALLRSGAKVGDDIWVSGHPGRAALGLAHLQSRCVLPDDQREKCLSALHQPQPRVALGLALRGIATTVIDVSDGLLADLGHIADASNVTMDIVLACVPMPLRDGEIATELIRNCVLAGGDDYELAFTAPTDKREQVQALPDQLLLALTLIGSVSEKGNGRIRVLDSTGLPVTIAGSGYDHFESPS